MICRVNFPPSVQIMALEFDPRCCTAQAEDSVRLYIPRGAASTETLHVKGTNKSNGQDTTAASEDHEAYSNFVAILEKYSGKESWPKKAVILPGAINYLICFKSSECVPWLCKTRIYTNSGNEVLFSLETASDYTRAEKDHYFGFRCLISGFEVNHHEGLQRLEMELAFLGGLCAFELVKKDLVLPPVSGISLNYWC